MICLYQRWRISRALDDDTGTASLPQRHMAGCADCRAFYRQSLQLERALGAEFPAAKLRMVGDRQATRWSQSRIAVAVMAAGLLVAALIAIISRDRQEEQAVVATAPEPTESQSTEPRPTEPEGRQPSGGGLLARLGDDVAAYARPAGDPLIRELESTGRQLGALGRRMLSPLPVGWLGRGSAGSIDEQR